MRHGPEITGSLPTCPAPGFTAVYRFYSATDVLLYIGICGEPLKRWYHHAVNKAWWPDVARFSVVWFTSREEAEKSERESIIAERPAHNVSMNGIPFKGTRFPTMHLHRLTRERLGDQAFSLTDLVEVLGIPPGSVRPEAKRLCERGLFLALGKMKGRSERTVPHYRALPAEGETT